MSDEPRSAGAERIMHVKVKAEAAIAAARDLQALKQVRIKYLGCRAQLPNLLRRLAQLPAAERTGAGSVLNEARRSGRIALIWTPRIPPNSTRSRGPRSTSSVERIAMLKHSIPDLRMLYDNDVRFLEQSG